MKRIIITILTTTLLFSLSFHTYADQNDSPLSFDNAKYALFNGDVLTAGKVLYHMGKRKWLQWRGAPESGQQSDTFSKIMFEQTSQAMQLAACIALDMLNLVEQNFGQPGRDFKIQMLNILKELERLKPVPLANEENGYYRQANVMASQFAKGTKPIKDCRSLNREYNQLKQELGNYMAPLGLSQAQTQQYYSNNQRTFYYTLFSERYNQLIKKMPQQQDSWQPLD